MSAIVRELVTVLGFKTDLKGIKDSEKALLSFQTKFAIGATAIATSISKTLDIFENSADRVLASKEVADYTGIALKNVLGMGQAASTYLLRQEDINSLLLKVNGIYRQAAMGQGELLKIADQTGIVYKDNNNQLLSNEKIFQNLLGFLGKIGNVQERLRISALFFGEELGARVAKLSVNLNQFNDSSSRLSKGLNEDIQNSIQVLDEFKQSIIRLQNAGNNFLDAFTINWITPIADALTAFVDTLTLFVRLPSFIGKEAVKNVNEDKDYDDLLEFENKIKSGNANWSDLFFPATPTMTPQTANSNINNITTTVDIQLPQGTNLQDTQLLGTTVADMVNEQIQYSINQLYNNNPQVA